MATLNTIITEINPLDTEAKVRAQKRLDSLIKPIGSLGKLEQIAVQLAGISGEVPDELTKKCIVIMCADNGIWDEGVSACPQSLTALQTLNFTKGICGINVLARHAGADLRIVDIGINGTVDHPQILNRKVRWGTANMVNGPAMSREEALRALEIGIEVVGELVKEGYCLLGTGEMGVANTSTSSAILMAFSGCDATVAVGKGAGLTETAYRQKQAVLKRVLEVNSPDPNDPLDVLAKVGGLDLAGLAGCFLGAAYYRIPIVIDGFISAAAALVACKLQPLSREFMIPSHHSAEPGFGLVMRELGLEPLLNLEMRLGEGTGCPLAFNLVEAAVAITREMATFETVLPDSDFLVDIRKG